MRSFIHMTFTVFLTLSAICPQWVEAVTVEDVMMKFDNAQADVVESIYPYRWGRPDEARALLEDALALLNEIEVDLQNPSLAESFGSKRKSLLSKTKLAKKSVGVVTEWVDPAVGSKVKPVSSVLSKLVVTAKAVKGAEEVVGKRLLSGDGSAGLAEIMIVTEPFARKDFWDKPNQTVKYKLYPPGWPTVTKFDTPPVVTIHNTFGTVVRTDVMLWDPNTNILTLQMGPDEGVARFEVTYQGKTKKHLMSCRGPAGSTSLPPGVGGLEKGSYEMSISGTVTAWVTGPTGLIYHTMDIPAGSYPTEVVILKNPKTFLNSMVKEANQIASALLAENGVKGGMALESVSDTGFTISVSVSMGTPAQGGRATVYITVKKI